MGEALAHLTRQGAAMIREHLTPKDKRERMMKDIRRKTREKHSSQDKIRSVLEGLRGEESVTALCRGED